MHFLAALSMKNRALIALMTVVVAMFGGIALTSLKQELAPSISFPQLTIVSSYPGASPEIVNSDVSTPIETAIQGITGLEKTATTSSTGLSRVTAAFTYGTDLAFAEQKLLSAVNRIRAALPDGVDPQVVALSLDDFPVIQVAVTGAADSSALADDVSRVTLGELKKIDGVRDATIVGNVGKRITITPDAAKVASYGLTTQAVRDALRQNGMLLPAGTLNENDETYSVQAGARVDSVDAVSALPLLGAKPVASAPVITATPLPAPVGKVPVAPVATLPPVEVPSVTIADVATVTLENNPTSSISRVNGDPALTIAVTKLPSANTVDVANAVKKQLPDLQSALAASNAGATFTTVFDQAPYIQKSIDSLATEGALGLLFAVLVILLFLFSVRATLVTAISIPTSVLITFIGLQATGYTLNILTLGALTIAIGRVVDDSIVVIENIKRHLTAGADRAKVIVHAVREVAGAITASTITTVAVFLPIALVGGVTGELFRPFSLTVTIALLASLLVSLTIVPVLAYWFLRPEKQRKHAGGEAAAGAAAFVDEVQVGASGAVVGGAAAAGTSVIDDELDHPTRLQRGYLPILRWTLKHGVVTVLLALLVLGGTIGLSPLMKTNFLGSSGQNTFQVSQVLPPGTSLEAVDAAAKPVESLLRDTDGVKIVQVSIGGGTGFASLFSGGGARVTYSITTEESANQDNVQASVRDEIGKLNDVGTVTVQASSGFGASSNLVINVNASNAADLKTATNAVADKLRELKSLAQVTTNLDAAQPYVALVVDRVAAAKAGFSDLALSGYVSQAMSPAQIGSVVLDEKSITVYLAPSEVPATLDELKALEVPTRTGLVRLDSLAKVELTDGPSSVTTSDQLRSASVSATPASDNLATANADATKALAAVDLPAGTSASIGGVTADQTEAFGQLGLALLAAIMIVYIVMVATFKSLLQPLLLLVSVPFAATGAIALQVITGVPLGVASMIGVLMLVGIVVTNAIVLVDLVNQYRDRGMNVRDALLHGASRRLRPILMTALATIFALLPMALGLTGHSGFISQPLALVVIGGLLSSTVLTLIVLPTLYGLVEGRRERRRMRRAGVLGDGAVAGADGSAAATEGAAGASEIATA